MSKFDISTANLLSACDARKAIDEGLLSSQELVEACFARIDELEDSIGAWTHLDKEIAMQQAREADEFRRRGLCVGALHGLPIGIKDIIDTQDYLTELGTVLHQGRKPSIDATLVSLLKEAGAIIMGKTVTTEMAVFSPGKTTNPHNSAHTPGGSSSGSAAAVASAMVPLAVGTQTNGSVIRPASFCGTYGFKPSRGIISRRGLLETSKSLDQVGCMGRSLEDMALLIDVIGFYDPSDPLCYQRPRPKMVEGALAQAPMEPTLAWFDLPFNDRLTQDASEGLLEVVEALGGRVEKLPAPPAFGRLINVHHTIHEYEICQHLEVEFNEHWDLISPTLQKIIERGRTITTMQYEDAIETMASTCSFFEAFYNDYDAVIAPAAPGEAPEFGDSTGDPLFSTIWTLAGLPCVSIPLLTGSNNLPIGVQLVGAADEDDRLLRTANWILAHLRAQQTSIQE
jgi:Asp-tRNA(Asn)/Glu-tRNA(Gln) amidotransferase A subunit family amidase